MFKFFQFFLYLTYIYNMPINRKTNFVDLQTCSGKFNCQYIRPGRNMNLQPVSGYISDNKYIQEM